MDVLPLPAGERPLGGRSDPDFAFASRGRVLKAYGVDERLDVALDDRSFADGRWEEALDRAFRRRKAQGVENPILVGAVPFDGRQHARLFIPEHCDYEDAGRMAADPDPVALNAVEETVGRNAFEAAVAQAIDLFRDTALRKVVLSRPLDVEAREAFAPSRLLRALLRQNPGAYVFAAPVAYGQTLVGASPELLIRKTGRTVISNPLAGSAPRSLSAEVERQRTAALLASTKDRTEHRYVVDAVRAALAGHCSPLAVPDAPSVIRTPTMLHLSTELTGELADPMVSSLRLAHALHPTPAICGTPTDLARDAIDRLEGYARNWYGGMVGWMDSRGNGEWALSIRCGLVQGRHLRLYAGAGVVADSDPAAEWEETAAKLTTMLNLFGVASARPSNTDLPVELAS
ncbi:isochorismate synthase (plasmid) [Azospirillum baldaniorum]|uniref:isochorismate synthase n=1 Tax=Azospirillum baldaniorum TaxID=1064539 RepID=A0A9P1JZZ7_9PROT|nr:isochorismate synthase [Azospirillum baldaniorum]AWJ93161.1 isochorismate synthase [Azospirillum baldaniorum]TWA77853.1 isochorismate synthase [Azospirillum brasilense]CCD03057.1 isochorismate synthase dhbC [Azospirillum baldaniorum]